MIALFWTTTFSRVSVEDIYSLRKGWRPLNIKWDEDQKTFLQVEIDMMCLIMLHHLKHKGIHWSSCLVASHLQLFVLGHAVCVCEPSHHPAHLHLALNAPYLWFFNSYKCQHIYCVNILFLLISLIWFIHSFVSFISPSVDTLRERLIFNGAKVTESAPQLCRWILWF